MPRKTVEDWEAKGWTAVTVAPDQGVAIAYDPASQDLVVKGQLYDVDGNQLTGHGRPKLRIEETATGGEIRQRESTGVAVVALYKVVEEEDEDEVTA
jgi:hypothetical protein